MNMNEMKITLETIQPASRTLWKILLLDFL